ncbi:Competence protein CoiA-like family protein [Succinivibrio dextrinosolvens]|nr:Competence protein CoiA-like family protein [Succinivibrio dextrinosolvens]
MSIKLHFARTKDGKRIEPQKGVEAFCPACGSPLIAKLGERRAHHWAHKTLCTDTWLSPETAWHVNWKNNFPKEWQEVRCVDEETGEIHIADVKTESGIVLEFQHSPIKESEIQAREAFYKDMFWIVDLHNISYRKVLEKNKIQGKKDDIGWRIFNHRELFPNVWLNRRAIVCFDYMGEKFDKKYDVILCLIPSGYEDKEYIVILDRNTFISGLTDNSLVTQLLKIKEKAELPYKLENTLEHLNKLGLTVKIPKTQPQTRKVVYKDMSKVNAIRRAYKKMK